MQADLPFYESPESALRAAMEALGGAKAAGHMLWPDKSIDNAGRQLLDCLNPSRAEKLDLSQAMHLLAKAKEKGHHASMAWICNEVGYEAPRPTTQAEDVDRVTKVIEQSTTALAGALATLERLRFAGRIVEVR